MKGVNVGGVDEYDFQLYVQPEVTTIDVTDIDKRVKKIQRMRDNIQPRPQDPIDLYQPDAEEEIHRQEDEQNSERKTPE